MVRQLIKTRELSQALVFVNSKLGAARLARSFEREGLKTAALHGDKSQDERLKSLDAFKRGEVDVLVATDVAARGLDIADLPAVFNFDVPYNPEDYVHRIGRTGRAGASGLAVTLVDRDDVRLVGDIERLIKKKIELEPFELVDDRPRRAPYRSREAVAETLEVPDEMLVPVTVAAPPARELNRAPREYEHPPREADRVPRDFDRAPRDSDRAPRDFDRAPRDFDRAPRDSERFPRDSERFARDAERPRRTYAPAAPAADPFFDKPYEPTAPAGESKPAWDLKGATPAPVRGLSPNLRSRRKVASLLGGGKA